MSNIFSQPGLHELIQGQQEFYSRQQKEKLNRDIMRAQAQAYRAKAQQMADPKYLKSQLPAAIQTAEHYSGLDPEGRRLFRESRGGAVQDALAKKGLQYDPTTQSIRPMSEFGTALGTVGAKEVAVMAPAQASAAAQQEAAKLQQQLEYQPQIKAAKEAAAARAEKTIELGERTSKMPELTKTLGQLDKLAKDATYTLAGQAKDFARTQMGMGPSKGAVARTEYDTKISNLVLPLLRQTFGAAFTAAEGESLRNTLGDINATPRQKQAAIRSFMQQARNTINSRERELGLPLTNWKRGGVPSQQVLDTFGAPDVAETTGVVQPNEVQGDVISYEEFLR
jgi:hypothetical protein